MTKAIASRCAAWARYIVHASPSTPDSGFMRAMVQESKMRFQGPDGHHRLGGGRYAGRAAHGGEPCRGGRGDHHPRDAGPPSRRSSTSGGTFTPSGEESQMLVAFSVTPLEVGEDVAEYVADAVRVVRDSGLPNRTDAMFTTVEGDWDEVMDVVRRAVDAVAAKAPRVSLTLKADVRPGVTGALESKVETLERYLDG